MWVLLVVFVITQGNSIQNLKYYERKGFKSEQSCITSGKSLAKEHSYYETPAMGTLTHGTVKVSFSCDYM